MCQWIYSTGDSVKHIRHLNVIAWNLEVSFKGGNVTVHCNNYMMEPVDWGPPTIAEVEELASSRCEQNGNRALGFRDVEETIQLLVEHGLVEMPM